MSYCIEYTSGTSKKYPLKVKRHGKRSSILWIVGAASVALLMIPGIRDGLKQLLLSGDTAITETALVSMMERLGAGESLYDAVTVFCKEIIQGAAV